MDDGRIGHVELAVDGGALDDVGGVRVRRGAPPDAARGAAVTPAPRGRRRRRGVRAGRRVRVALDRGPEDSPPAGQGGGLPRSVRAPVVPQPAARLISRRRSRARAARRRTRGRVPPPGSRRGRGTPAGCARPPRARAASRVSRAIAIVSGSAPIVRATVSATRSGSTPTTRSGRAHRASASTISLTVVVAVSASAASARLIRSRKVSTALGAPYHHHWKAPATTAMTRTPRAARHERPHRHPRHERQEQRDGEEDRCRPHVADHHDRQAQDGQPEHLGADRQPVQDGVAGLVDPGHQVAHRSTRPT